MRSPSINLSFYFFECSVILTRSPGTQTWGAWTMPDPADWEAHLQGLGREDSLSEEKGP